MNTLVATGHAVLHMIERDIPEETCFHCGLQVSKSVSFGILWNGKKQPMCCIGCEAVANMIIDCGLDDFYRHRSGYSTRPDAMPLTAAVDSPPQSTTVTNVPVPVALYLSNLTCAACVWLAEKTLSRLAGVVDVRVNFTTHSVRLQANNPDADVFIAALARVGLVAERIDDERRDANRIRTQRKQLVRLGIATLSMMQVMMLTVPLYFATADDVSPDTRLLMGWAAWLMTLPALLFSARPIFAAAWRGLLMTHIGMDLPVAIALALTFIASTFALLNGHGHLYFDAIAMFVFLLLVARWIEGASRDRAISRIERMANPKPVSVFRLTHFPASEDTELIGSHGIRLDDTIIVEQGAIVPADGTILRGSTEVDEALMTGESAPVVKHIGDRVIGGTINTVGPIVIGVTAVGERSVLSQLARLAESGLMQRPLFHGFADQVARYLAPSTLVLAACGALIWAMIDASKSLDVAVAILAISCPCAFALAAPTAAAAALGTMAERGLLVVRGSFLETLATATDVVFDKTGTITTGQWQLANVVCDATSTPDVCLAICGALESGAIHPVARAVQSALRQNQSEKRQTDPCDPLIASVISHFAGQGVEGTIDGTTYRFGTRAFALADASASIVSQSMTNTLVVLSMQVGWKWSYLATFEFSDKVRPDAAETIARLARMGIRVHMLSGDQPEVVSSVAVACGLEVGRVRATQSADNKRAYVVALQAKGRRVVAIGDGINDAPMLAAADAGIGVASGAALTRLSSDAVLDENKQHLFPCIDDAFARARKSLAITRQNIGWAFAYNVIALPLAFLAMVTPFIAAIGMAASSLIVVINSSRLWSWNRSGS